jgi:hypothetical protein
VRRHPGRDRDRHQAEQDDGDEDARAGPDFPDGEGEHQHWRERDGNEQPRRGPERDAPVHCGGEPDRAEERQELESGPPPRGDGRGQRDQAEQEYRREHQNPVSGAHDAVGQPVGIVERSERRNAQVLLGLPDVEALGSEQARHAMDVEERAARGQREGTRHEQAGGRARSRPQQPDSEQHQAGRHELRVDPPEPAGHEAHRDRGAGAEGPLAGAQVSVAEGDEEEGHALGVEVIAADEDGCRGKQQPRHRERTGPGGEHVPRELVDLDRPEYPAADEESGGQAARTPFGEQGLPEPDERCQQRGQSRRLEVIDTAVKAVDAPVAGVPATARGDLRPLREGDEGIARRPGDARELLQPQPDVGRRRAAAGDVDIGVVHEGQGDAHVLGLVAGEVGEIAPQAGYPREADSGERSQEDPAQRGTPLDDPDQPRGDAREPGTAGRERYAERHHGQHDQPVRARPQEVDQERGKRGRLERGGGEVSARRRQGDREGNRAGGAAPGSVQRVREQAVHRSPGESTPCPATRQGPGGVLHLRVPRRGWDGILTVRPCPTPSSSAPTTPATS